MEKPTLEQLAITCSEEIDENWQRFARNNQLNDYFVQQVIHATPTVNYMQDINALSVIETKINLTLTLHAPEAIDTAQIGWIADFKIGRAHISTPVMLSEAYARCFNILLFLKLSREINNNKITLS